ncbi:UPF0073 membrane protein [Dictyocoela muelleri]|nr:UPF0073 membrane protein [Dictyocoela muelleri]
MDQPLLRGKIHMIAFVFTMLLSFLYIFLSNKHGYVTGITIYLFSQLLLFGVSSIYHNKNWKSKYFHDIFQKLDHASIFILISGTQTCVSLLSIKNITMNKIFLKITWSISIAGIIEVLFFKFIPHLNVAIYIFHGVSCIPFFKYVLESSTLFEIILYGLGGLFYIVGGVIYAIQKPNPFPMILGFHEVFHILTVLGNLCFLIPMIIRYLYFIRFIKI